MRFPFALATAIVLMGGVLVADADNVATTKAAVRAQTDSLRAETYRPNGWAPRKTWIRRFANRIDSLMAAWTPDTVAVIDTVAVVDTVVIVDTVVVRDTVTPPPPPPPPPPDTLLRSPELPRTVPTFPGALLTRACTDRPTTAAALQTALNAGGARTICLAPGLTLTGNWNVPARVSGDTGWSVLRVDSMLTPGQRVQGTERLPRLVTAAKLPVLHFHSRSARWLTAGVEITTDSTVTTTSTTGFGYLVFVGEFIAERTLADLPRDVHFSHLNIHGWLLQDVNRALALNGAGHVVRDSRCTEIHNRDSDSQCVLSYNGPGPFLIENNLLEAAAENIMFGGGDPGIAGLVSCDITVRGNLLRKPVAWKAIGTPTQSGSYNIKLLYESKNACRSLIERNRMDGSWLDGQTGYAVGLKSVNQNGGCPWCRVTDVTFRDNVIVNVGAGFGFAGRPEHFRHPVDTALSRVLVTGNWIDSLNVAPYTGDARGILLGWQASDIAFVRNTWAGGNWTREAAILANDMPPAVTRFRFDDNVIPSGVYGFGASAIGEGLTALNSAAVGGGWSFARNTFIGPPRNNYPVTTRFAPDLAGALATGAGIPAPPVGSPAPPPPPPPPPPDTTTPPPPPPSGKVVQLDPSRTFQTISGWQAGGQGWGECVSWDRYKDEMQNRLVNELGITRMTVGLRTGSENDRDYYSEWKAGLISDSLYRWSWYKPVNDNADPSVADPARFHFGFLDDKVMHEVLPVRALVQARGDRFYLVLTVVDFLGANQTRPWNIVHDPAEYAELVTQAFLHLRATFGFVPDALEVLLEPETTLGDAQSYGDHLGRALLATKARLAAAGFAPEFILPSTAKAGNAPLYWDRALATGARPDWISYHRYNVPATAADLAAIGARGRSAMLEWIGATFAELYDDLTIANVSAWMRFNGAFCGNRTNLDSQGVYYQIDQSDPANPRVNMTHRARLERQVFAYVRPGAVRLGAVSGDTALRPLAFRNRNGGFVVVVRTNGGATFTVRGLPPGTYTITHALDGIAVTTQQPTLVKSDAGDVMLDIPAKGVITISGAVP